MSTQLTYKLVIFSNLNKLENTSAFHSSFSGKEKDSETGYHYFGARYYNSDLSLWLSVDPMSDKYPSLSPYNYCDWNPVKLVDPDGMKFDSVSMGFVDEFRKKTISLISEATTSEQRTELMTALEELSDLESSDQLYHILEVGESYNREKGGTYYQSVDNSIGIEFDGKFGNLAHELKHAYQFEKGELSFSKEKGGFGELYDITDEQAALRRGGVYDKKQYETLKNIGHTYRFNVKGDPKIDSYYPFLNKRPNSHSIVGNRTFSRTVQNSQTLQINLSNDYYKKP